jgi:predicted DNA-binding transcriptional regulator
MVNIEEKQKMLKEFEESVKGKSLEELERELVNES